MKYDWRNFPFWDLKATLGMVMCVALTLIVSPFRNNKPCEYPQAKSIDIIDSDETHHKYPV